MLANTRFKVWKLLDSKTFEDFPKFRKKFQSLRIPSIINAGELYTLYYFFMDQNLVWEKHGQDTVESRRGRKGDRYAASRCSSWRHKRLHQQSTRIYDHHRCPLLSLRVHGLLTQFQCRISSHCSGVQEHGRGESESLIIPPLIQVGADHQVL